MTGKRSTNPDLATRRGRNAVFGSDLLKTCVHSATALAIVVLLLIPLVHVVRLEGPVLAICLFAALLVAARFEFGNRHAKFVIAGCFLAFVVVQIFIAINHSVEPYSDFQKQWVTAVSYAQDGLKVPDRPQTQRAIPFYYPLVSTFGSSAAVYIVANIVVTSLSFLITVWIARRYFGWSAAARTAILLPFGYEAYFANTIPSHDILGAFGILLFFLLCAELQARILSGLSRRRRLIALAGFGVLIGLVIAWTQWQRSTGVFCIAVLLVGAALAVGHCANTFRYSVAIAVIGIAVALAATSFLTHRDLVASPPSTHFTSNTLNLLAFGSADGNGRVPDKQRKYTFVRTMAPEVVKRLGQVMFLETLRTRPADKYENFLRRTKYLLRFGKENSWYFRLAESWSWASREQVLAAYDRARELVSPIVWSLLILVCLAAIARKDVAFDHRLNPFLLVVMFMFVMGMLAESQGRYAYFVFYLAAIYAGAPWLRDPFGLSIEQRTDARRPVNSGWPVAQRLVSLVAVGTLGVVAWFVVPRFYDARLTNFDRADVHLVGVPDAESPADFLSTEQSFLTVSTPERNVPANSVTVSTELAARDERSNTLRFVVRNSRQDVDNSKDVDMPERTLRVIIDGTLARAIDLRREFPPTPVKIAGIARGEHDITLEIQLGTRSENSAGAETTIAYLGFY